MNRRYPIRAQRGMLVFGALFFGACAAVLFWQALQPTGVIVNGLEFGVTGARIFFGVLVALSLGLVGAALFALVRARDDLEVVLADDSITAPISLVRDKGSRRIRFADITNVRVIEVSGHTFLSIESKAGKIQFERDHLPAGAFDEIATEVRSRGRKT